MARPPMLGPKSIARLGSMLLDYEGAPQQSSHRRARWPVAAGGTQWRILYIVQDIDGETGGNPDWFARGHDTAPIKCNDKIDGTGREYLVYLRNKKGVWFTGERIFAVKLKDPDDDVTVWHLGQTGESHWEAEALADITSVATPGQIQIQYYVSVTGDVAAGLTGTIAVDAELWDASFNVVEGQKVFVRYDQQQMKFFIMAAKCPGEV